jgi:hypothetical protein
MSEMSPLLLISDRVRYSRGSWEAVRASVRRRGASSDLGLVIQNHVQQRIVDLQVPIVTDVSARDMPARLADASARPISLTTGRRSAMADTFGRRLTTPSRAPAPSPCCSGS